MPIHDWTRVEPGIFHDFHHEWVSTIKRALNDGLLPKSYYAMAEQVAGGRTPDVLTLERSAPGSDGNGHPQSEVPRSGGIAVETAPPRTRFTALAEHEILARKKSRVAIRHTSDDTVVAIVEIVSPGNKDSRHAIRSFVEKAVDFLRAGIHLLIIDLFPPTPRDPRGIHAAVWSEIMDDGFTPPEGEPLTLVAYRAADVKQAYIEPTAVGRTLADMPLFLEPGLYVPVPLEETYQAAFEAVPQRWREELERPDSGRAAPT